jgi:methylaspartate ammonia-lyase
MSRSPLITSILTIPGLSTSNQGLGTIKQRAGTILVGIVIDESKIAWGSCEDIKVDEPPEFQSPFLFSDGMAIIEARIVPLLVGQKLTNFRDLAARIEALRETVTIKKPISQPEKGSQGISRRAIITGFLSRSEAGAAPALEEQQEVERPIHPALRHGLSQALLSAVSMVQDVPVVEVIAKEFELPLPSMAVPLQMPIKRGQSIRIPDQVTALAYTVSGIDPVDSLGPNSERIQRFIRRLRERLIDADQHCRISIHLDAKGSLGKLYGHDLGKILGALNGLEQAAAPCLIRVQDPLIMDDLDAQIKVLGQLRDYLRMRRMSLQLVAGAKINSLAAVRAFVQAKSAHMLRLVMPQIGAVQELVLAVQACQLGDVGVLMEVIPSATTSQVALATQPDVLTYPADRPGDVSVAVLYNEMARTLSWLAHKDINAHP